MDEVLAKLETPVPRPIQRRLKAGEYDVWAHEKLTFKFLLFALPFVCGFWLPEPAGPLLLFLGAFLALAGLRMGVSTVNTIRQHSHLVKYGHAAVAEITKTTVDNTPTDNREGKDSEGHIMFYKFVTDAGDVVERKWTHVAPPFQKKKEGKLVVLYNPKQPSQSIAYDTSLYEVVS